MKSPCKGRNCYKNFPGCIKGCTRIEDFQIKHKNDHMLYCCSVSTIHSISSSNMCKHNIKSAKILPRRTVGLPTFGYYRYG